VNRTRITPIIARAPRRSPARAAQHSALALAREANVKTNHHRLLFLLLISFFLLGAFATNASAVTTCTALTVAAGGGNNNAVTNGIDGVDWGSVRFQWTCSGISASLPVTSGRILFCSTGSGCTNAGTPGAGGTAGPNIQGMNWLGTSATSPSWIIGQSISTLQPSTTYYIQGQSLIGGAWVGTQEQHFTTPPKPAITPHPNPPVAVPGVSSIPPIPAAGGTNRIVGTTTGCTPNNAAGLQACINISAPGDAIGLTPGVNYAPSSGYFYTPDNPNSLQITQANINVSASTFTLSSGTLTNGTQVRFGVNTLNGNGLPLPLIPGYSYTVLNSTGSPSTFQINDGTNTVALTSNTGYGYISVIPWPISQNYVVLYSTAPNPPPTGVRLDPVAYNSTLPIITLTGGLGAFRWGALASYYWFQDIEFTTPGLAIAAQTDPPQTPAVLGTGAQQDHIVFNQSYFSPAGPVHYPTATNDRSEVDIYADGSNIAITNSYLDGADYWRLARLMGVSSWTYGGTTLVVPAGEYDWVNNSGTRSYCTNAAPATLTFSGSGSGLFYVYFTTANGACGALSAQLQTGVTAAGSVFSISSASTPAYPNDGGTLCGGGPCTTGLPIGIGTVAGGTLTSFSDDTGSTTQGASESGIGVIHVGAARGPGPILISNNYLGGTGVVGIYMADDGENPCGGVSGPAFCPMLYSQGNLTAVRNTVSPSIKFFQFLPQGGGSNPVWDGQYPEFRNGPEMKECFQCLFDGNIIGPITTGTADGGCGIGVNQYTAEFPYTAGYVNYISASDYEARNNTCLYTGGGLGAIGNPNSISPGPVVHRIYEHNNLMIQNNAWTLYGPGPYPLAENSYHHGDSISTGQVQDIIFDHNTFYLQGGDFPLLTFMYVALNAGMSITNNVMNLVTDNGTTGMQFSDFANNFGGNSTSTLPACGGSGYGTALLACMSYATWQGNLLVPTYSNSDIYAGGPVDITTSAISTLQSNYPTGTLFPAGSSSTARIASVGWFNPSSSNLRLKSSSPYISGGANHAVDGLDVGVDMDALEAAQGKVSNVHAYGTTSTATTVGFVAPDSFGCSVDWGTVNFTTGSGSYTRVTNAGGQRVQDVMLSGLPAHSLINYRVNCAVQQPAGAIQLP
jgi:hypothetical protein